MIRFTANEFSIKPKDKLLFIMGNKQTMIVKIIKIFVFQYSPDIFSNMTRRDKNLQEIKETGLMIGLST